MGFWKLVGKSIEASVKYSQKLARSHVCNNCGYEWVSRKDFGEPAICPRCNSKRISKILENKMEDELCGHCGRRGVEIVAECQYIKWYGICGTVNKNGLTGSQKKLCSKCANECNKCGKFFCPKHINSHSC